MKDNLLKEAIADARAVKETAIANAMMTLKESFKPQLTSMLASKLRNEEEGFDMDEQKKLDSSDIAGGLTVDEPSPKKPSAVTSTSSDIENPGLETDTFGEGIDDMAGMHAGAGVADAGGDQPDVDMTGGDDFSGEGDDLDLEAIIRELEADLMGPEAGASDEFGSESPAGIEAPAMKPESFVRGHDVSDPAAAMKLEGEAEGIEKDGKDVKSTHGLPGGKQLSAGSSVTEGEDEEVDLEEILREVGVDEEADMAESEQIASENVELKRSLREHREVIKLLRNRINEVTLLNSKLMYTSKVFRSFNLTENQKKNVIAQFDRATTLREAKLVYSTLAESLTGRVNTGSSRKVVQNITEGASKTVSGTKPKSKTVLTEGSTQVARFQKLAGIVNG